MQGRRERIYHVVRKATPKNGLKKENWATGEL